MATDELAKKMFHATSFLLWYSDNHVSRFPTVAVAEVLEAASYLHCIAFLQYKADGIISVWCCMAPQKKPSRQAQPSSSCTYYLPVYPPPSPLLLLHSGRRTRVHISLWRCHNIWSGAASEEEEESLLQEWEMRLVVVVVWETKCPFSKR